MLPLIHRIIGSSVRHPRLIAALGLLAAAMAVVLLVTSIRIDTNLDDLIDPDTPFRQRQIALDAAFPHLSNRLVVVISGASVDGRLAATTALVDAALAEPETFETVFAPAVMPDTIWF